MVIIESAGNQSIESTGATTKKGLNSQRTTPYRGATVGGTP
ncbi:MAG: hypothetical protein ACQEW5_27670 [Bacillota bacterium]